MESRKLILIYLLTIISLSSISLLSSETLKDFNPNSKKSNYPTISSDTPNSKPLLINQYATVSNSFFPLSLPTNVSFTLVEGWTSKNVTIYYEGITHKKDYVSNGDFITDSNGWNYRSNSSEITDGGWISDGYVRIKAKNSPLLAKDYGFYEQNISIQESLTPNKFSILSLDYLYDSEGTPASDISLYLAVEMGGVEKNKTIYLTDLVELSWTSMTIVYDPMSFGQNLPGNVSIRAGFFVENAVTPAMDQTINLDHIKFETWTSINQRDLITVYDNEFCSNYTYNNVTYGKGNTFIDTERSQNQTSDVIFTISKNSTVTENLEVYNITIRSELIKSFNSTVGGLEGSTYSIIPNITWQTDFTINYPYNYLDNWLEIQKPSDWSINHIFDGYNVDRIGSCSGAGIGTETMVIPFGILNQGLWKIEAISTNYIKNGNIAVWNGSSYEECSILGYGDSFQIQAKLNDTVSLDGTFIQCIIQYPNGSLFLNETLPASQNVDFGNYSAFQSMIVGVYDVLLEWNNNESYLMRDKIGFKRFNFTLHHNTNLKAVNSYYETMAGGPLLVKVNFTDSDIDTYIDFASVTYNTTYGAKGNLAYFGSGIYVIDLDTSLLPLGDYYISFNASKDYYQSQEIEDLIQVKIIAESLLLEVPRTIINAEANSFIKVQINLTGSTTGSYYNNANMSSDWQKNYTKIDFGNGTWEFNLSTFYLPTSGIPELYNVHIFANKTGYGSTADSFILRINPIPTDTHLNQTIIQVYPNHNFFLKLNYTIESSGELIAGANISIGWAASYNCSSVADGFQIFFNTSGLLVDYYPIYFELNHAGYETAFSVAYLMIIPAETQLSLLNPEPIEIIRGDSYNISCLYTSDGENLINSTLNLIGDINGSFIWNGTEFYSTISTQELESRSYLIHILATNQNFEPQLRGLVITVFPLDIKIQISSMTFRLEEGHDNLVDFTVYDESHNCLLAGFNVSYEYNGISNILPPISNGTYQLNLNRLSLNPLTSYHNIKLIVSNPYGEDEIITILVYTSSFETILTISISIIISAVAIVALGLVLNKRYIGVSKFQRKIRTVKRKLKNQKYDKILEPSKENIIRSLFDKKVKIPLTDRNGKKLIIKEKK
ncbi:MAG: hypothetical protein ACFFE4_06590 [Candidatus Thorarchaeota archaeon]